jgi:hypothetical protein
VSATGGGGDGLLDEGYDATNHAFLLGSVTLQALAGSAGLSTDIVLSVGAFKFLIGSGDVQPLLWGLGETTVDSNRVGATDGTAHATITVAAQGPSALVTRVRTGAIEGGGNAGRHTDPAATKAEAKIAARVRAVLRRASDDPPRLTALSMDQAIGDFSASHTVRRSTRGVRYVLPASTATNWSATLLDDTGHRNATGMTPRVARTIPVTQASLRLIAFHFLLAQSIREKRNHNARECLSDGHGRCG